MKEVMTLNIHLKKILSEHISSRESVKIITNEITKSDKNIVLDFKDIYFVSSSFVSELQEYKKNNEHIKFEMVNLNDNVAKMVKVVALREKRSRKKEKFNKKDFQPLDLNRVYA